MALFAGATLLIVRGYFVRTIHDEKIDRGFTGFEFQAELFLHRGGYIWRALTVGPERAVGYCAFD
jgi:hypothetical protein